MELPSGREMRYRDVRSFAGLNAVIPRMGKMMRLGFWGGTLTENFAGQWLALRAIDASTGERKWEIPYADAGWAGVTATAGGEIKSSWRPQEAVGLQVFDQIVRNVNANRTSEVRDGRGKKAKLGFERGQIAVVARPERLATVGRGGFQLLEVLQDSGFD